jgi:hypothetical protein
MFEWLRDLMWKRMWRARQSFPPWPRIPFEQSLDETQRWCSMPGPLDPSTGLRTRALMPWILESNPAVIVHLVAQERGSRLRDRTGASPERHAAPSRDGRFLVHYPGLNLTDGAAEDASDGFFDQWNTPPWDTWVAYGSELTRERDLDYGLPDLLGPVGARPARAARPRRQPGAVHPVARRARASPDAARRRAPVRL